MMSDIEFQKEMARMVEKAKTLLIKNYSPGFLEREWSKATPPDAYEDDDYRVEIYVLCGSPSKAGIVADYGYGVVKAFGPRWVPKYTYRTGEGDRKV